MGFKILALVAATLTGFATILGGIMMIASIGLRSEYGNHTDAMAEENARKRCFPITRLILWKMPRRIMENPGRLWRDLLYPMRSNRSPLTCPVRRKLFM